MLMPIQNFQGEREEWTRDWRRLTSKKPCLWRNHLSQCWANLGTWLTASPPSTETDSLVLSLSHLLTSALYLLQILFGPARGNELFYCKPYSQVLGWPCHGTPGKTLLKKMQQETLSWLRLCLNFSFPFRNLTSGSWFMSVLIPMLPCFFSNCPCLALPSPPNLCFQGWLSGRPLAPLWNKAHHSQLLYVTSRSKSNDHFSPKCHHPIPKK